MEKKPEFNKPLKHRIVNSVFAQIIGQLLTGCIGVVILKLMTSDLGPDQYGLYATTFAFVSTFAVLTNLGINSIATREVAKHPDQASVILSYNLGLRLTLSLLIIPIVFGLNFLFYPNADNNLRVAIAIMSLYLLFDTLWATSAAYYSAKVRNDVSAKNLVLQQIFMLSLVCLVYAFGWKLYGYVTSYVIAIGLGSFILLYKARRHIDLKPTVNVKMWKATISASLSLGLIMIINSLYLKIDGVMLSVIAGPTMVGIYGVAYMLISVFNALPSYIMTAVAPSMAVANHAELELIVQKAFHLMAIFSFILFIGCYFISSDAVVLVSSQAYMAAAVPFVILSISTVFSYFSRVTNFALIAIDKHHKFVYVSIASLIINVSLNLYLIRHYGVIGAAWSTVATEFVALTAGYVLFRKQTGIKYKFSVLIKPATIASVTFLIGLLISRYAITNTPFINCLIIGLGVTVPYFIFLYIFKALPSDIHRVIQNNITKLTVNFKNQ